MQRFYCSTRTHRMHYDIGFALTRPWTPSRDGARLGIGCSPTLSSHRSASLPLFFGTHALLVLTASCFLCGLWPCHQRGFPAELDLRWLSIADLSSILHPKTTLFESMFLSSPTSIARSLSFDTLYITDRPILPSTLVSSLS